MLSILGIGGWKLNKNWMLEVDGLFETILSKTTIFNVLGEKGVMGS